jgi:urease accessory protein
LTGDRLRAADLAAIERLPGEGSPQVDLRFAVDSGGNSWVSRQHAAYPFHLGRSWHVPGDPPGMATVYLQCSSGGIFQDDDLRLRIEASAGARAHVTTAASTIVHGVDAGTPRQTVDLHADAGAVLEYLPDPQILFPRGRLQSRVTFHVHPSAIVIAADALVPHDPSGTHAWFEELDADTRILGERGQLLARDRFRLRGEMIGAGDPGVTGGWRCQATFFALQRRVPQEGLAAALRAAFAVTGTTSAAAATVLPNDCGVWARVLALDAVPLRQAVEGAWSAARALLLGRAASPRRK